VIIPEENAKDLAEIPDSVKNQLSITPVSRMEQVLEIALSRKPEAIEWDETSVVQDPAVKPGVQPDLGITAH
jgi:ATP-dependent Lon protease